MVAASTAPLPGCTWESKLVADRAMAPRPASESGWPSRAGTCWIGTGGGGSRTLCAGAGDFVKDLRLESEQARAAMPGIGREPCLHARVNEKCLAVPSELGGHLRKQQTAPRSVSHD